MAHWPVPENRGAYPLEDPVAPLLQSRRAPAPERPYGCGHRSYPFIMTGHTTGEGRYFAFFPFGGTLRGFFGKDRIRFALFPLYADTKQGEHRSWHVLWPIFRYSKGGGRTAFRFFPLFGWKKKDNWYKKVFVLWPFFAHVQTWIGTDRPCDSWFFLPFYGRQQTPFGKIQYFLYPFFSYQRNDRPAIDSGNGTCLGQPLVSMTRGDRESGGLRSGLSGGNGGARVPQNVHPLSGLSILPVRGTGVSDAAAIRPSPVLVLEGNRERPFPSGASQGMALLRLHHARPGNEAVSHPLAPTVLASERGLRGEITPDFWKLYQHRRWADGMKEHGDPLVSTLFRGFGPGRGTRRFVDPLRVFCQGRRRCRKQPSDPQGTCRSGQGLEPLVKGADPQPRRRTYPWVL